MDDLISRADAIACLSHGEGCGHSCRNRINALPSADAEFADMPDIPRYYYEKVVGNMAHEINTLKEQLESVDAEWIPVSERLPSEDGRYLVTYPLLLWQNNWINLMHYGKPSMPNCEVKGKCFYVSDDEWGDVVYDNIIAWMPLPKPYREDGE